MSGEIGGTYGGWWVLHLNVLVAHERPRGQVVPIQLQRSPEVLHRLQQQSNQWRYTVANSDQLTLSWLFQNLSGSHKVAETILIAPCCHHLTLTASFIRGSTNSLPLQHTTL